MADYIGLKLRTSLIPPHPALDDYIYNYSLCKSESGTIKMNFPWVAHHDISLCFFGDTNTGNKIRYG